MDMNENLVNNYIAATEDIEDSCLLSFKVFGQCYQQDCLKPIDDPDDPNSTPVDAPKLAEDFSIVIPGTTATTIAPNGFIIVTDEVATVNLVDGSFSVCSVEILSVSKSMIHLETGYWDIKIRYKFTYDLELIDENGAVLKVTEDGTTNELEKFKAFTSYTKLVTLFGGKFESSESDVVTSTTLLQPQSLYTKGSPQVMIEAKAINYPPYIIDATNEVSIIIGLFTIIKVFRVVQLLVEGRACTPPKCEGYTPSDPCTIFKDMDFPFDDFNPSV
jgi:hypothetical protein